MSYSDLVSHYESCFDKHGDNHLGVDWPRKSDAINRYRVMTEIIRDRSRISSILDFGCGAAHLYEFILDQKIDYIQYSGLDLSSKFISACKKKYPYLDFSCADILSDQFELPSYDYILLNGVFTEKLDISHEDMWNYLQKMLTTVYSSSRIGIAFNLMSKHVDWERDDLFHVSFDQISTFLSQQLTRHFIIRHNYGLYEYTVYAYRNPDLLS